MTAEREFEQKANGSAGSTEEEIIELTDVVGSAGEEDDGIIELVDEVAVGDADPAAIDAGAEMAADAAGAPTGFAGHGIRIADEIEDDLEEEADRNDFVDTLGMDLETSGATDRVPEEASIGSEPPPSTANLAEPASSEQIEAAVERVLLKILPEKIDSILREAVEKTLTREIDKIKEILLEDSDGRI